MRVALLITALLAVAAAAPSDLERGLVAHYRFDAQADGVLVDESGNGNDLAWHGSQEAPGLLGRGAAIGAQFGSLGWEHSRGALRDGFTIAFWLRKEPGSPHASKLTPLVSLGPFAVLAFRDGLVARTAKTTSANLESESLMQPGAWYHVAFAWSPQRSTLFLNGEMDTTYAGTGDSRAIKRLRIGVDSAKASGGGKYHFRGAIDEVRIYDRVLDAAEVERLASAVEPSARASVGRPLPRPVHIPAKEMRAVDRPLAVPTFHSIGLYWGPPEGSQDRSCRAEYRVAGSDVYRAALPLWYDARNSEYRGSLVHLEPNTRYEIRLSLAPADADEKPLSRTLEQSTWSEDFPVARTVVLPARSESPLVIDQSGSAAGYVEYVPAEGQAAVIDVDKKAFANIEVKASYVILRGLTLRGAQRHGIALSPGVHDVVIEGCDIRDWGSPSPDRPAGFGKNNDSAIASVPASRRNAGTPPPRRIIIQGNRLHHPTYDAHSEDELGPSVHTEGPQAVTIVDGGGQYVIRYNSIHGDTEHYFADALGAGTNYSDVGFPNRDSDIYGNHIQHVWDDAIESEGGNRNVRIWGNLIEHAWNAVALKVNHAGPLYVWRNVIGTSRRNPDGVEKYPDSDADRHGALTKAGDSDGFGGGKVYVFHNTTLQPPPPEGRRLPLGVARGFQNPGGGLRSWTSRNNILHVMSAEHESILNTDFLTGRNSGSDFDYDLYNGRLVLHPGQEKQGVNQVPVYRSDHGPGRYSLAPGSPGHDAGARIPNFNDDYRGKAPDMGAHEDGAPLMRFGVDAWEHREGSRSPDDSG